MKSSRQPGSGNSAAKAYGQPDVDADSAASAHATPGKLSSVQKRYVAAHRARGEAPRSGASDAVAAAQSSAGRPLPSDLGGRLETSLDADLSSVRIHDGQESATAAAKLQANAFTLGQDVHFGAGKYDPHLPSGKRLIAHEVAHTVQQAGASSGTIQEDLEVSTPGDAHEVEAENFAQSFAHGGAAVSPVSERAPAGVSRDYGLHEEEERPLVRIKSSGESVAIHAGVRLVNVRTDISISRNVSECRIIMDRRLEVLTSDGAEFLRTTDASLNNIKAALFGVVVGAAASPFVGPAVGGGIGSAAGFGASEFLSRTAHPWSFGDVLTSNIAWIGTQYRETGLLRGPRRGPVKDRAPIGRLRDARKHPWKEWSPEHRKSWSVLGWTERSWTENVPPPSELLAWSELSEPEQRAARKLGFNKLTWQAREGSWVPDAGSVVAKDETALHLFGAWAVEYERDPMRE